MPEPDKGAASAWQTGIKAANEGDYPEALRWLERAVRLAPGDPRIALDLANIRLRAGGADQISRAALSFEALTARYDVVAGWLGLLAARRLQGEHEAAALALQQLLFRHCVPQDLGFAEVASAVAAAAGRPGWCGINASGVLHIAAPAGATGFVDGAPAALPHFGPAPETGEVTFSVGGASLLGSPLHPVALRRCEGVVETAGAALTGWVSWPAAPNVRPKIALLDSRGKRRRVVLGEQLPAATEAPLIPRYGFYCPAAALRGLAPPLRVVGPDGADIFGSPIDPAELAAMPVAAADPRPAILAIPPRAKLMVVVPVYAGLAVTQACLRAALQALPPAAGLVVVDDASPEPAISAWLDDFCQNDRIRLLRHTKNLGFPAAVNAGLQAAAGCDVLLLNSDTLLPPGALKTLLTALYSRPEIGSVTPLSNEATICSYPHRAGGNPTPDLAGATALNALAASANANALVEIPTGIGFCLLMRHDCIASTGYFRPEIFAQGYGEEVDWCLRARQRGYLHVAATGAYVAHLGGTSFKAAGHALNLRNFRRLTRLYPDFEKQLAAHDTADPLAPARRNLDIARFKAATRQNAVLLISHHHGGGVARQVAVEMQQIRAAGLRPILLFPAIPPGVTIARYPYPAELTDNELGEFPNLRFTLPEDEPHLLTLLQAERIGHVNLHHGLGHHPAIRRIAEKLGCPQDIVIHDYASFCPRVHLLGPNKHYCGEPDLRACAACVAKAGDETFEGLSPKKLLARSGGEFAAARRISAPSHDASRRIARHFPTIIPAVTPWEDDSIPRNLAPPRQGKRRIAVLGGIGPAKGFNILLECAHDARHRNLNLEFVIAGTSFDDETLLETGRIFITGPYQPGELPELMAGLHADLAFIPSIWPETWCFTLTEAWAAGLYTLAFDLGAQAERIDATRSGGLLPLGLPAPRINDVLLNWSPS